MRIQTDCGPDPVLGTQDSHMTVEGVSCDAATGVALSTPNACDYSAQPQCDVGKGWTCSRTSEEGADVFVLECTKADARIKLEAPVLQ